MEKERSYATINKKTSHRELCNSHGSLTSTSTFGCGSQIHGPFVSRHSYRGLLKSVLYDYSIVSLNADSVLSWYPSDRGALSSWQLIASPDRMRPLSDQLRTDRMVCDMDAVLRIDQIQVVTKEMLPWPSNECCW